MNRVTKTTSIKTIATLGLLSLAAMNSSMVMADDSFWYGGANIGQSTATIDDARIRAQLQAGGLTTSSLTEDDSDLSYKIFGGYQVNKNFAVEAGYFNLGKFGYTATTVPTGSLTGKVKLQGLNIDAVGMLPFAEKFSAFGRIGAQYAQARDTFTGTGAVTVTEPNPGKSSINYKAGVGLQYDFNQSLGMRAEVERHRINDAIGSNGDIDTYSVGLVYRFGEKNTPARKKVRSAAAPIRIIVPLAVKTQKYCSL
ncbi:MAG: outer membrane beta-barrel protein [Candidatus Nitrotoga sp.]